MKKVILIDASYVCYYRFFAAINWYRLAKKELYSKIDNKEKYDWSQDTVFMETYKKMFFKSIEKIFKKDVLKDSKIIFCCDPGSCTLSENAKLWRKEIYQDYKGNRQDMSLKHNLYPVFNKTLDSIIPDLINTSYAEDITLIKIPKIEADDIIAYICKNIILDKYSEINILSADDDFTQLLNENTRIIDFRTKKFRENNAEESKKLLLHKILNGDNSDNIKRIFTKRVKKAFKTELVEDSVKLQKYLDENPEEKEKFLINQRLIDFNFIPEEINIKIKKIIDKYEIIV
jgi:5'-3' exonuclease